MLKVEVVDDPAEQAAGAAMVVCVRMSDKSKPDETVIADVCSGCGAGVWVSPISPAEPPRMCHDCAIKRVKSVIADGGEPVFMMTEEMAKEFGEMADKAGASAKRNARFEQEMRLLLNERLLTLMRDWADTCVHGGADMAFVLSAIFNNMAFVLASMHMDFADDSTLQGFQNDIAEFYEAAVKHAGGRKADRENLMDAIKRGMTQ